jgi:hypothetical protein
VNVFMGEVVFVVVGEVVFVVVGEVVFVVVFVVGHNATSHAGHSAGSQSSGETSHLYVFPVKWTLGGKMTYPPVVRTSNAPANFVAFVMFANAGVHAKK